MTPIFTAGTSDRSALRQADMRGQTGFTLIEILVVMLIIGVVSGMAVLSLRMSSEGGARGAAGGFRAALNTVALDGLTRSRQYGLRIWEGGYAFVRLNDKGKWVSAELSPTLNTSAGGTHSLADGLRARLRIAGEAVRLRLHQDDSPPQVLVLSNGEMTPFEIVFEPEHAVSGSHAQVVRVAADAVGHLTTTYGDGDTS